LYLVAIFFVQIQELNPQAAPFAGIAYARHSDDPVFVWKLEPDDHPRTRAYRLFGIYEETAGADIGHVSPHASWTAAGVRKFVLDLSRNRGTLEPSPL
jgi:hypothetical protein